MQDQRDLFNKQALDRDEIFSIQIGKLKEVYNAHIDEFISLIDKQERTKDFENWNKNQQQAQEIQHLKIHLKDSFRNMEKLKNDEIAHLKLNCEEKDEQVKKLNKSLKDFE